jgi:hypothetical protein
VKGLSQEEVARVERELAARALAGFGARSVQFDRARLLD